MFKFLHLFSPFLFSSTKFLFFKSGFKLELIFARCEFRCVRVCANIFYTTFFKASFERFVFLKFAILDYIVFFFLVRGRNQPFQLLHFKIWNQKLGPTPGDSEGQGSLAC